VCKGELLVMLMAFAKIIECHYQRAEENSSRAEWWKNILFDMHFELE
jgi:hypothetical protein